MKLLLLTIWISLAGIQPGIRFTESGIATALKKAKAQHKPVFVDAYASWCAPCREMQETTFRDKRISTYLNSHYINAAIDVEKGSGTQFAEQYEVNSYPTLLLLDEHGKVMKRIEGFVDAADLAKLLNIK